ncbi:NACHT domain-containing protein [Almyronema epifaneia]
MLLWSRFTNAHTLIAQSQSDPSTWHDWIENLRQHPLWAGIVGLIGILIAFITFGDSLSGFLGLFGLESLFRRDRAVEQDLLDIRTKLLYRLQREVKTRLENSLHELVKIDLQMEDQRQRVGQPKLPLIAEDPEPPPQPQPFRSLMNRVLRRFKAPDPSPQTIAPTQRILSVFESADIQGKLLILGEPGSGKTTELLTLAQELLAKTEQDELAPVPIIFELSTWKPDTPLDKWLTAQIKSIYKIDEAVSQQWLNEQQLLPLLDGLDELGLARQQQCVEKIDQFSIAYPYLAVCCRREEYEAGQQHLESLNGAVYLKPLTDLQIQDYLRDLHRDRLWLGIQGSLELLDLARSPLFLAMLVVAYRDEPIRNSSDLFNAYIDKQLSDPKLQGAYLLGKTLSKQQTVKYLCWLAQKLESLGEAGTEFLIEEMQPSWLESASDRRSYRLIVGLSFGLSFELVFRLVSGLEGGLILGLIFGPIFGNLHYIEPLEQLSWSTQKGLNHGVIVGIIIGLIAGLMDGLTHGLLRGLSFGLAGGLMGGLIISRIEIKSVPNQGIHKSGQNTLFLWLLFGLLLELIVGRLHGRIYVLLGGLFLAIIIGLRPVIQHYVLRFVIAQKGYLPWDIVLFLEHATQLRFIQRTGGRYRFIHDLLRKHFAYGELPPHLLPVAPRK